MRVLHIMASGAVGGGLDHLLGLVPALAGLGVEGKVAIGHDGPGAKRLAARGIDTLDIELMASRLDPLAPVRIRRLVRAQTPQITHFHGVRAAFFGALADVGLRRRPSVYTVHGLSYRQELFALRHPFHLGAEALACRAAREVITVAAADRQDLIARGFVAAAHCTHLPNAVDAKRFCPGDQAAARQACGLPRAGFIVGCVSRLVRQKAVGDLIAAAKGCSDLILVIAGDGPQRATLAAQAAPLGDRVLFLGTRNDVPELLRACDLFVLSSRWEGEPVALIEAMATGLPCIATATPGSRELLAGDAGLLVGSGSPTALCEAIEALRNDPKRREALGRAAREKAASRGFLSMAPRVVEVYRRALC